MYNATGKEKVQEFTWDNLNTEQLGWGGSSSFQ